MNTKLLYTTAMAAVFLSSSAFAEPVDNVHPSKLSGAYIGAYGGYDWSDIDTNAGVGGELDGWDGGVFVGYKLDAIMEKMDGFGIGLNGAIEGFYGWSDSSDNFGGGVSAEKDQDWGISFRPGLSFLQGVTGDLGINPYGILGYRNTEYSLNGGGFNSSEHFDGFDLGIGTQLIAFGDFGVRAEYTHTWYSSEAGFDPDSDEVRIGLSYHF